MGAWGAGLRLEPPGSFCPKAPHSRSPLAPEDPRLGCGCLGPMGL